MNPKRDKKQKVLIGPYGVSSLAHAAQFQAAGVNAAWFHGFDASAFAVCDAYDLAACVEFPTFRADFARHPELVPIGVDGRPIRYGELVQGVCLSNQDFLAEIELNLVQGIERFKPRGIWFDYLTYAGWFESAQPDLQDSCFCRSCVADFCQATGVDEDRPSQIVSRYSGIWQQYKCDKIAGFALHYAHLVREKHPECLIGIYMCPWQPDEYGGALGRIFAQDYDLLAPAIDVFTPLIYVQKSGRPHQWGREFLEASTRFVPMGRQVQLILDYLDFPYSLEHAARSAMPSWGIQMYGGGGIFEHREQIAVFRQAADTIRQAWQDNEEQGLS